MRRPRTLRTIAEAHPSGYSALGRIRHGTALLAALALVLNTTLFSAAWGAPPAAAITDGFYGPSDGHAFVSVPLFDSQATGRWPCQSDAARRNLSEVGTSVRDLSEDEGRPHYGVSGRGCQLINDSASGTTWYGWMYPDTSNGVADFNGGRSGTGDPRHADTCYSPNPTSMGPGKVRIVGELEKPPTGLGFSASITLSAMTGQCVTEGTLASYTLVSIPGQQTAETRAFDVTVAIPDATRDLALTIRGGEPRCTTEGADCGVYVHYFRMYASLGANAVDPWVPPPTQQLYGTGSGIYGNDPTHLEAEPVNTATGNYVHQDTDFALPGRGLPLAFTRTYNSLVTASGPLGVGWTFSDAAHLTLNSDGSATFTAEDGAQYLFGPDGSGGFVRPGGTYADLVRRQDGTYDLTRRDRVMYHFDAGGVLLSETGRNGNALTFAYTSGRLTTITDAVGRSVTLSYDGSGRLSSLAAPLSRTVTYTYDANGRLATVTDLRGKVTRYTYDANNRLTTIVDPNGHPLVTNEYGTDGRVSAQTDARGKRGTFSWNTGTQTSTFTDARGGQWVDVYASNVLQSSRDPLGNTWSCPAFVDTSALGSWAG